MTTLRALVASILLTITLPATADDIESFDFASGNERYKKSKQFTPGATLHFQGQDAPAVNETLDSKSFILRTSQKIYKDNTDSAKVIRLKRKRLCEYVLASTLRRLQQHAAEVGADGIINIKSNYKGSPNPDIGEYDCIFATVATAVELHADFVTLAK